jgi:sugar phosphate isomerase/epimerase
MEKIGLQLYSVKELTQKDFLGTLAAVAKAGYDGVEFAGYFDTPAKELRKALDDNGLKACGSHIGLPALDEARAGRIAYSQTIGSPYIVCPAVWGDMVGSADAWKRTAERLEAVGRNAPRTGCCSATTTTISSSRSLTARWPTRS